jgi:hypothetical protein
MMITLYIILQLNMFIIESWGDILPPKFYAAYAWSLLHTVVSSDTYTTIELFLSNHRLIYISTCYIIYRLILKRFH